MIAVESVHRKNLWLSRSFVFIYFLASNGSLATLTSSGEDGQGGLFTIIWMVLYAIEFLLLSLLVRDGRIARVEIWVIGVGLYAIISMTWSELPFTTFTYGLSVFSNLVFAILCARVLSPIEFFRFLMFSLLFTVIIGLLLWFLGSPVAIYIDPLDRANVVGTDLVKGLFSHKIYAGYYSAIGFVLSAIYMKGFSRTLICFVFFSAVILSGSSLGLVALILSILAYYLFKELITGRGFRALLLPIGVVIFIVLLLSPLYYIELLGFFGREATLTGRTDLWGWAYQFWLDNPVLGWGYSGIFSDSLDAPSRVFNDESFYQAPHFHSGYLQVLAELGVVGFLLFFRMIYRSVVCSYRSYMLSHGLDSLGVLVLFSIILVIGFAMNTFMRYNELTTIIIAYCFISTHAYRSKLLK